MNVVIGLPSPGDEALDLRVDSWVEVKFKNLPMTCCLGFGGVGETIAVVSGNDISCAGLEG